MEVESASGWTTDDQAKLVEWVGRPFVAGGLAALPRDDNIESLTLADLEWYVAPPKVEEVQRAVFRRRGDS